MKYGYMPSFEEDIKSEIEFAKKYFDFLEITLPLGDDKLPKAVCDIEKARTGLKIVGHLHWGIDLSSGSFSTIQKAVKTLSAYKRLGVKKITCHPSTNDKFEYEILKRNNYKAISKILSFCEKHGLQLCIENLKHKPFSSAAEIKRFTDQFPQLGITLDIGHALSIGEENLDSFFKFGKRIKHVHLHDAKNGFDHIPFTDNEKLKKVIKSLKEIRYNGTITLEIFNTIKNNSHIQLSSASRRKKLLEQLKSISNIASL
ncbi:MAG: sugar phosphate isomerase/epimerase [Candidatus Woesearchaeota archaeon]|nr:sugar phosphate isomerase/epimerase [Candidatus Woesearchaeota archaeon]